MNSSTENLFDNQHNDQIDTLAQTPAEFLRVAASMLNYTYAGDPLKLESFITVAELVETFASNADTKAICVKFIKAKLESKALECLPDQIETVKDITDALRNANQPESSC